MAGKPKVAPAAPKSPMEQLRDDLRTMKMFHDILSGTQEYKSLTPHAQDILARYQSDFLSHGDADRQQKLYDLYSSAMQPAPVTPPPTVEAPTFEALKLAEDNANKLAQYQARNRSIGMMPRVLSTLANTAGDVASAAGNTIGAVANVPFATMQAAADAVGNQTAGEKELGFANIGGSMGTVANALGMGPKAAIGGATDAVSNLFHGLGNQTMSAAAERIAQANNLRLQNDLMAASATPSQRRLGERFVSGNTQMYKNNVKTGWGG